MMQAYCKTCDAFMPVPVVAMRQDVAIAWAEGDMLCPICSSIIATLKTDQDGLFAFHRVGDLIGETNEHNPRIEKFLGGGRPFLKRAG